MYRPLLIGHFMLLVFLLGACRETGMISTPCEQMELENGDWLVTCPDGTEGLLHPGKDGESGPDGTSGGDADTCSLTAHREGQYTLQCGERTQSIDQECNGGFPGDVYVGGTRDNVMFLQYLHCTTIQGSLFFAPSYQIDSGETPTATVPPIIQDITNVTGSIHIESHALATFAMPKLTHIGGDFQVSTGSDFVLTIQPPQALTTIDGSLYLQHVALENGSDFPALVHIGGDLELGPTVDLHDLSLFSALRQIDGVLALDGNADLASLQGLEDLIANGIIVRNNPMLADCHIDDFINESFTNTGDVVLISNNGNALSDPDVCDDPGVNP